MSLMRDAGISVWICSGDKYETTKAIGKQCKLYDQPSVEIILIDETEQTLLQKLLGSNSKIRHDYCELLAISGPVFAILSTNPELMKVLRKLLFVSKAVIFFRMLPS